MCEEVQVMMTRKTLISITNLATNILKSRTLDGGGADGGTGAIDEEEGAGRRTFRHVDQYGQPSCEWRKDLIAEETVSKHGMGRYPSG